jgi:hypothetical protein
MLLVEDAVLPLVDGATPVDVCGAACAIFTWLTILDNAAVTPLQAESNITATMKTLVRLKIFLFMGSSRIIS